MLSPLLSMYLAKFILLITYAAAIVFCFAMRRRATRGSTLAILGLSALLANSLGVTILSLYLTHSLPVNSYVELIPWINFGDAVLHAVGIGLVVAGVFAGRPPAGYTGGFDVQHTSSRLTH